MSERGNPWRTTLWLGYRLSLHPGWERSRGARLLSWIGWGNWQCGVFGHAVVPRVAWCMRCDATWADWSQAEQDPAVARWKRLYRHRWLRDWLLP